MNIDIRKSIRTNFQTSDEQEILTAITSSIQDGDEVTLPGLGVFFEILWQNSSSEEQTKMVRTLKNNL